MSGFVCIAENCELIGSPPNTSDAFRSRNLPISLMNLNVCTANSRVGDRTMARAPLLGSRRFSFSNSGIKKQAVLPDPVLAMATTSRPSRISGIVWNRAENTDNVNKHNQTNLLVSLVYLSLNGSWDFVAALGDTLDHIVAESHSLECASLLAARLLRKSTMVHIIHMMIPLGHAETRNRIVVALSIK